MLSKTFEKSAHFLKVLSHGIPFCLHWCNIILSKIYRFQKGGVIQNTNPEPRLEHMFRFPHNIIWMNNDLRCTWLILIEVFICILLYHCFMWFAVLVNVSLIGFHTRNFIEEYHKTSRCWISGITPHLFLRTAFWFYN